MQGLTPKRRYRGLLAAYGSLRSRIGTGALLHGGLIITVALFWFGTLREGHNWDGDYALYIMHARNIITGQPYAATGFIPNPLNPIHPAAYPPGLPLLLAAVYLLAGLDLQRMKLVGVVSFIVFLVIFGRIAKKGLPSPVAWAVTAAVGFQPYFWDLKDTIFSELPFMLFCYATLPLADGVCGQPAFLTPAMLGASATLAAACLTRSIGVLLFPTILALSWYKSKKLINPGIVLVAIAALVVLLARLAFPNDVGTYLGYFRGSATLSTAALTKSLLHYRAAIAELLAEQDVAAHWMKDLVKSAFLVLMAAGFVARLRDRISVLEVFFITYWLFLLVYPEQEEASRYALPVWPLTLFYAFAGADAVGGLMGSVWHIGIPTLLFGGLCALYWAQYEKMDFGPIPFSVTDPTSRELFGCIKTKLPADAVLVARKPTIIALFTGRRAGIWPSKFRDPELWWYMGTIGARYLVQDPLHFEVRSRVPDEFDAFIERNRSSLTLTCANRWFRVYEVSKPL